MPIRFGNDHPLPPIMAVHMRFHRAPPKAFLVLGQTSKATGFGVALRANCPPDGQHLPVMKGLPASLRRRKFV